MKRVISFPLKCTFILGLLLPCSLCAEETVIDAIVATVEGNPITMHDLNKRLPGSPPLELDDIQDNPMVAQALQQTITEHLLEAEAQSRQIGVSESEVTAYLSEVARRNNMSVDEFSQALQSEGLSIEQYARRIKMEILKSKFGSRFFHDDSEVSDEEIDAYLSEHPELTQSDGRVTLSQIFLDREKHSEQEAIKILTTIKEQLKGGLSFPLLAVEHSESPESRAGGALGELVIADLSSSIKGAIKDRTPGEITDIVTTAAGWHLFHVDQKAGSFANNLEELRVMIGNQLREKKTLARLDELGKELQKSYVVDRKY